MSKNSNSGGKSYGGKKSRKGKFEPGAPYLIIKVASKPVSAFGSHVLSQERVLFTPPNHDEAVKFFQDVIASTQTNEALKSKMLRLTIDEFMREFSVNFTETFVPFHNTSSFVEKMIELEIFRKVVLQ